MDPLVQYMIATGRYTGDPGCDPMDVPYIREMVEDRILPALEHRAKYDLRNERIGDDDLLAEMDSSFAAIFTRYDLHTQVLSGMLVARPMTARELEERHMAPLIKTMLADDEERLSMELIQELINSEEIAPL